MSELPVLTPRPLAHGDRVAILSPAGIIKPQLVYNCLPVLADRGWVPYVGENTFNRFGTYAGTDDERYSDLETALLDPDTRAIICARGGYGAVHLLRAPRPPPAARRPEMDCGLQRHLRAPCPHDAPRHQVNPCSDDKTHLATQGARRGLAPAFRPARRVRLRRLASRVIHSTARVMPRGCSSEETLQ